MAPGSLAPTSDRDLAFSGWLDLFRGLAAFAVLYWHARVLFLSSIAEGQSYSPVVRALYVLSGYGHTAVMVFFVLSGYLVGGTVIRAVRDGRWSWRRYLLQRGTRLYVVLIPALLLTLAWDAGEQAVAKGQTPNDDTASAVVSSQDVRDNTSADILAGNVAFLQAVSPSVVVPPLGSNGPLWSLTNEFWYYIIFPMFWLAVAGRQLGVKTRGLYLVAACTILLLIHQVEPGGPAPFAFYFPVWLLGALVSLLPEAARLGRDGSRRFVTTITAAGFCAALLAVPTRAALGWGEIVRDAVVSVAFVLLLYCMKHNHHPTAHPTLRRISAFFANYSYTLYLVHLPPLIFLRACLTYETAWPPVASSWAELFLVVSAVMVYAYLVSLVTERQTDRLRRWIERQAGGGRLRAERELQAEVAR